MTSELIFMFLESGEHVEWLDNLIFVSWAYMPNFLFIDYVVSTQDSYMVKKTHTNQILTNLSFLCYV